MPLCKLHVDDLRHIVEKREAWRGHIESLKRMRQWVLDAERILDGSWASTPEQRTPEADHPEALPYNPNNKKETHRYTKQQYRKQEAVTNEQVALRFDRWREHLALQLQDPTLPQQGFCEYPKVPKRRKKKPFLARMTKKPKKARNDFENLRRS